MSSTIDTSTIDTTTMSPTLYVHSLRPQWGMGLVTSREPERMRIQFEDGENRTFARGYYNLLEEAAVEKDTNVERVFERLMRAVGVSEARASIMTRAVGENPTELADQIAKFKETYPTGFVDKKWVTDVRGESKGRRLKRYRQPAVDEARRILSRERMKTLRDEGQSGKLWDGIMAVLKGTDLVSLKKDVTPLQLMSAPDQAIAVRRLYDLLYGDTGSVPSRFNHWIAALSACGSNPTWKLATILPALVLPEQFVFVSPTTMRRQAKWMAPKMKVGREPIGRTYVQIETMTIAVRASLEQEDLKPRDLMDVSDFMRLTLKK